MLRLRGTGNAKQLDRVSFASPLKLLTRGLLRENTNYNVGVPRTYASPARDKIEAAGLDWVCEQLEQGKGQVAIAKEIGVSTMSLNDWLRSDPVKSARARDATIVGAESYESQADQLLSAASGEIREEENRGIASAIVALAKERAQVAWRRAAVRDPRRYDSRRTTTEITGLNGAPVQFERIERVILNGKVSPNDTGSAEVPEITG